MVAAAGVLGRAGLAADVPAVQTRHARGAVHIHAPPHALDDRLEMFGIDLRVVALVEAGVDRVAPLDPLDDMRDVVVAAVGDDRRKVCQLQRRAAQGILADREREHRQGVPRLAVLLVVVGPVGDIAVALVQEVGTQLAAEAEALDILPPDIESLLDALVLRILQDIAENVAEVGVARGRDGIAQIEGGRVRMALHLQPPGLVAHVADVAVRRAQHPLLQPDEPLHQLEGRARRVLGLHGPVEERLPLVVEHLHVVVAAFAPHQFVGVVRRRGDHHQDLPGRGLDGHRRTDLAAHELLAEQLQPRIDRAHKRAARHGQRIVVAVHVGALDRPVRVALEDLDPLLAPQLGLVGRLHAADAHIVARLVGGVALEHVLRNLADIAQQVAADLPRVVAHGTVDGIETAEVALVEAELLLLGDVVGDQARRPGIDAGIGQLAVELLARDAGNGAQPRRVEAVAVVDLAARRILHLETQHVAAGHLDIARIDELNVGQPPEDHREDQQHDHLQGPHADETFGTVHTRTESLTVKTRTMIQTKASVRSELTRIRITVCRRCSHERASSRKKTVWCMRIISSR